MLPYTVLQLLRSVWMAATGPVRQQCSVQQSSVVIVLSPQTSLGRRCGHRMPGPPTSDPFEFFHIKKPDVQRKHAR